MKNLCQIKKEFLNSQDIKTFTNQQSDKCKNKIQETGLSDCMESMKSNKTSGNDGSSKEFDETFWDELKIELLHEY